MLYKLRDFDWSQRLVLSSDKLSLLRRPVLLLKLDLLDDDGDAKEVVLEFEEHELKEFVRELGSAHEALRTLVDI